MLDPSDIHALTDFQRNARAVIRRLTTTGRPQLLTVNGRAAIIVQDPAAYQRAMGAIERLAAADEQQRTGAPAPRPAVSRQPRRPSAQRKTRRKAR